MGNQLLSALAALPGRAWRQKKTVESIGID
jgi:hypothetical protein